MVSLTFHFMHVESDEVTICYSDPRRFGVQHQVASRTPDHVQMGSEVGREELQWRGVLEGISNDFLDCFMPLRTL